jgi:hypothetical protein
MFLARPALAALLAAALAAPLSAQVTVSGDAAFNSQYQWRGLTTTNRPVVQPTATVAFPAGRVSVTAGAFANLEGGRYNDADRQISENGGTGAGLAEYDLWLETAVPLKRATLTFGATTYGYPNSAGTTSAANTLEAYVKAEFVAPFAPSIAVWNDVQKVGGAYAEVGISRDIRRVSLGAVTGWNIGQSSGDGSALGYFSKRGFTHADLSAGSSWTVGRVTASPSLHVVVGGDRNTFVASPTRQSHAKIWVGTSLSMARVFKKPASAEGNGGGAAAAATTPTVAVAK